MSIPIIILFVPACIFNYMNLSTNVITIGIKIITYTIIYSILLWFFALNDYEKSLIMKPINKIFKKANII